MGSSLIEPNTVELTSFSDNSFEKNGTDTRFSSIRYYTLDPVSTIYQDKDIEFKLDKKDSTNDLVMLHDSILTVACRIMVEAENGELSRPMDGQQVGPCNNFLHSMFHECEIVIDGNGRISDSTSGYAYKAFLQNLLSYDGQAKICQLYGAGWHEGKFLLTFNHERISDLNI